MSQELKAFEHALLVARVADRFAANAVGFAKGDYVKVIKGLQKGRSGVVVHTDVGPMGGYLEVDPFGAPELKLNHLQTMVVDSKACKPISKFEYYRTIEHLIPPG